jgi:hypothetical protein
MNYTSQSNWVLESHTDTPGRGNVRCHRWRWVSVDTGEILETTTDSTMRNWNTKGWNNLSQDPHPWGVYQNIHKSQTRETNRGVGVASADHRAQLQHRLTQEEAEWMINEIKRPTSSFGELFEVE